MPKFNVCFTAYGHAIVEADDADEAEEIVAEAARTWDAQLLEEFEVTETDLDDTNLQEEDDD